MAVLAGARIHMLLGLLGVVAVGGGAVAAHSAAAPSQPARLHRAAAQVGTTTLPGSPPPAPGTHWITSWGAATQGPNTSAPLSEKGFSKRTLREAVFVTAPGSKVRVRFSNVFGSKSLHIGAAAVAVQSRGATAIPGTTRQLRFYGSPNVTIRAGHQALSDPVKLSVRSLSRLLVSIYVSKPTGPTTQQIDSRLTSFSASGSRALQPSAAGFRQRLQDWYFLSGVETYSPPQDKGSVIALGDSITAGVGSALGANATWPEDLARRLGQLPGATLSVVDEGIGGNRVLNDSPCCGISAVARFQPDVVKQVGARTVILLEGVNDLGFSQKHDSLSAPHTRVTANQVIAGYKQIIAVAHRHHLRIIGGTLTPFKGARYWTPAAEQKRQQINNWILTSGAFDGVVDFAAAVAEPGDPQRLAPADDSGDHLHPNDAGYRAMANAVPLSTLF